MCDQPEKTHGPVITEADVCPFSQRVDGPWHSWRWDGDDPRIICHYCNEMRDALTGRVIIPGRRREASAMFTTSHTGHGIVKCSCGALIRQCRCMDQNKPVVIIPNGCDSCKRTPGMSMKTERFDVAVSYQARTRETHIIFADKDGIGMRACTFTPAQREQLIEWLIDIRNKECEADG